MALFHLDSPPKFPDHLALDYCLLGLLLRLFLAWRWVRWPAYWFLRWIVDRNWRILKRLVYHILTEVQVNHIRSWFLLLPFGYSDRRWCSLEISPHPDETGIFWGWHTMSAFTVGPAPLKQLIRALRFFSRCKWGCHRDTLSQEHWASPPGSCWCIPEIWPTCWSIQKTWPDIRNGHNGSWRPSSTHRLSWLSLDGRYWLDQTGWNVEPNLADPMIFWLKVGDTGSWWSDYWDLGNLHIISGYCLTSCQIR